MSERPPIAVVGMGCVFPGAGDPDAYWRNIEGRVDTCRDVPPGRWILPPASALSARPDPDKVLSLRGCFVEEFILDPSGLDIDPDLLARLDPLYHLVLHAGRDAFRSSRMDPVDRSRVGVILAAIALPTESSSAISHEIVGAHFERRLFDAAGRNGNGHDAMSAAAEALRTHPLNAKVTALPAALLAKALGLGGGSYTLDAACASSLYALKLACDELADGRADAMLAGGVSRPDCLYTQLGFTQLRALSSGGRCAPFDESSDGLIVGEGAGLVLLKRLDDAIHDGDDILGIIRGIGLSNDIGGSLLAPDSEGQLRAMRAAHRQAGWRPDEVDLIECHGTGTPLGDAVEIRSLRSLWENLPARPAQCPIGSVKSMIGHLLTGAGAAGLMKVLLAMKAARLPPSLNFCKGGKVIPLEGSPFRVQTRPEDWPRRGDVTPRRAAISAFGFGGINAHVLIEEHSPARSMPRSPQVSSLKRQPLTHHPRQGPQARPIAIVGMSCRFGAAGDIAAFHERIIRAGANRPDSENLKSQIFISQIIGPGQAVRPAALLDDFALPLGKYHIPPNELLELLPQQTLMLDVAAAALENAGMPLRQDRPEMGAIIGIGFDFQTTDFHLRWWLEGRIDAWTARLGLSLDPAERSQWLAALRNAISPALNPTRTLGALGSVVASRIAREFRLGGPSFSVSCEEASGLRALEIAIRALQSGEMDAALIGAVDLAGDIRSIVCSGRSPDDLHIGEGAAAVVLMRLEDVQRDQDRIYAIIPDLKGDTGSIPTIANADQELGHTGAVSGLATLLKAAICISDDINPRDGFYWSRNRADGPRRVAVRVATDDGQELSVLLEEPVVRESDQPLVRESLVRESLLEFAPHGNPFPCPLPAAIITLYGNTTSALIRSLQRLRKEASNGTSLDELAARAAADSGSGQLSLALVSESLDDLLQAIDSAQTNLDSSPESRLNGRHGVYFNPSPLAANGQLAFVFPGSGNHFVGMGRELLAQWPEIPSRLDGESGRFADHLGVKHFWPDDRRDSDEDSGPISQINEDVQACIFAQVTFGVAVSDLLRSFGVEPAAMIGYSLGESAALFASRAWPDRDEMYRRMEASPLFKTDLAGPRDAVRLAWGIAADQPIDWRVVVVPRRADQVREALGDERFARLLIVNTPGECVIGGLRSAVESVVRRLRCRAIPIDAVPSVHCDAAHSVEEAYRRLHLFDVNPPAGLRFYSAARAAAYEPTRESAAESITAQALHGFDFPALIERAYADGVRLFVEIGPQNSCTRMVGKILGDRPHLARSASIRGEGEVLCILNLVAALIAEGLPVDLRRLYPASVREIAAPTQRGFIRVPVRRPPCDPPLPSAHVVPASSVRSETIRKRYTPIQESAPAHVFQPAHSGTGHRADGVRQLAASLATTTAAVTNAHESFLQFSRTASDGLTQALTIQSQLLGRALASPVGFPIPDSPQSEIPNLKSEIRRPAFSRSQCLEFARGKVANVLGRDFALIDTYPVRVRLPDEPLMLVDRILTIEGEKRSLTSGRLVTEHDVLPGAWYLDGDRCPICITVEAGQADLFLSGYLGIDFVAKGERTYRLLDATVTFHRGLPRPGETIRYDIRIDRFVRQRETYLFFFEFDGTIKNELVLTMRNGCAGFFTKQEIENSHGIVLTSEDTAPQTGKRPSDFVWPIVRLLKPHASCLKSAFDDCALAALRSGDLAACFGPPFDRLPLSNPLRLPSGRMKLIDRVLELDPHGGRYGLGHIRAEADIHPDDWFLTCHFVDDMVMPGTLMYECCAHTLRFFLLRMGWIGESDGVAYEPIPGVQSSLKCRGPVTPATSKVHYELHIKEVGYRPEPYILADALMYADGKRIVRMDNMSLQMTGVTRERMDAIWNQPAQPFGEIAHSAGSLPAAAGVPHSPQSEIRNLKSEIRFSRDQILSFATGNPSDCFGEPYRVFDRQRRIARLPGPPYQFLDRVTKIEHPPFLLEPTDWIEAEYDVPPDAWYFAANRQPSMPFAILLEIALQPCGFLAAYCGSALISETDLSFRNLGGTAVLYEEVFPDSDTLRTRVRMTDVSRAGGMIIQKFDMQVLRGDHVVYEGDTSFGFFSNAALAQQVGIRDAASRFWKPSPVEGAVAKTMILPDNPPFTPDGATLPHSELRIPESQTVTRPSVPSCLRASGPSSHLPSRAFRMIDRIDCLLPDGGPLSLGFIQGSIDVDHGAWFFKAHFFQDPVWPGSLGLEAFLQLLKVYALDRWPGLAATHRFEPIALGCKHNWAYRGQVLPVNRRVEVQAVITRRDDAPSPILSASGFLSVDGIIIYEMTDFGLRLVRDANA